MKNEILLFIKNNVDKHKSYIYCDYDFYNENRDIILKGIERNLFIPCNFNEWGSLHLVLTRWVGDLD